MDIVVQYDKVSGLCKPKYHVLSASKHGKTKRQQRKSQIGAILFNKDMGIRSSLLQCLSKVRVLSQKEDCIKGVVDLIAAIVQITSQDDTLLHRFRESHLKDHSLYEVIKTILAGMHHKEVDERRKGKLDRTWWKHYNELIEYMEAKEGWDGILFVEQGGASSGLYDWWRRQVGFDPNWKIDDKAWKKEELRLLGVSFNKKKIEKAISSKGDHVIAEEVKAKGSKRENRRQKLSGLNDLLG